MGSGVAPALETVGKSSESFEFENPISAGRPSFWSRHVAEPEPKRKRSLRVHPGRWYAKGRTPDGAIRQRSSLTTD